METTAKTSAPIRLDANSAHDSANKGTARNHLPSDAVIGGNFRHLPNLNLTVMQTSHDWNHTVLQRLIIVFLGLLTLGVLFNSCSTGHGSCAAYDQVKVEEVK
jgi:hypothetical protein